MEADIAGNGPDATGKYTKPVRYPVRHEYVPGAVRTRRRTAVPDQRDRCRRIGCSTCSGWPIRCCRTTSTLTVTDPSYNPYRTIDPMPVDVTAFNGVATTLSATHDPDPGQRGATAPMVATHFQSRQRGDGNDAAGAMNLWKQEPTAKDFSQFADAPSPMTTDSSTQRRHSSAVVHEGLAAQPGLPEPSRSARRRRRPTCGDPSQPFPWLTWNNRPWVSPLELMLVPWLRSSQLLRPEPG